MPVLVHYHGVFCCGLSEESHSLFRSVIIPCVLPGICIHMYLPPISFPCLHPIYASNTVCPLSELRWGAHIPLPFPLPRPLQWHSCTFWSCFYCHIWDDNVFVTHNNGIHEICPSVCTTHNLILTLLSTAFSLFYLLIALDCHRSPPVCLGNNEVVIMHVLQWLWIHAWCTFMCCCIVYYGTLLH